MTTYASIADYVGRAQPQAPVLLADVDCTALETADWLGGGAESLGTIGGTASDVGSPSQWGPVNGAGLQITGGTYARFVLSAANIAALATRALTPEDGLIIEIQVNAAMLAATATNTRVVLSRDNAANNNTAFAQCYKSIGANRRLIAHWNGSAATNAVNDTAGPRTISMWCLPGGALSLVYTSTSDVDTIGDDPLQAGTMYRVSSDLSRCASGDGVWEQTGTSTWTIEMAEAAGETVDVIVERVRIFLLPGSAYTP